MSTTDLTFAELLGRLNDARATASVRPADVDGTGSTTPKLAIHLPAGLPQEEYARLERELLPAVRAWRPLLLAHVALVGMDPQVSGLARPTPCEWPEDTDARCGYARHSAYWGSGCCELCHPTPRDGATATTARRGAEKGAA